MEPRNSFGEPRIIVVMGVAASGKSTVGLALAQALGWSFYEGDELHPAANKAKMHAGHPLTDEDRAPWPAALCALLGDVMRKAERAILACSALKASYRTALVPSDAPPGAVRFVYLDVPRRTLEERLASRHHFFPPSLLQSQLETLEPPRDATWVDGAQPVREIVESVRSALRV